MADVAYTLHGNATAGAPMLLTHGFGASQAMWAPNLDALAAERRVLTWDLPGHGASAATGEVSHERCVAEMLALADELGAPRTVFCGMSLGGFLSLLLCARHPERVAALVLVDTGPGFRDRAAREAWNTWALQLAADLERRGPAALAPSPETNRDANAASAAGLASAARGILTQRDGEVLESLGEISVPTLIVVGAQDERFLAAAQAMERRIPRARRVVIDDAGHAANMDQPAEFNAAVRAFLRKI